MMENISISYMRIWAVFKKESIQLKRDITTIHIIIAIPIIQLLLFGFAIEYDPKHMHTAVLMRDNNIIARNIISSLTNSRYFAVDHTIQSEEEGRILLQKGVVNFMLVIPENFSRNLIRHAKPNLLIEADATDPIAISGALGAVNQAIEGAIRRDAQGALASISPNFPLYEVRIHRLYNHEGLSRYNIVPGLIAIILTMTCVTMTSISLTKEKERGTMENLLAMPVKPIEVMLGKVIPYIAIGYMQAIIILLAAYFVFDVPILGNLSLLIACLLIFIICNLAIGFTLSAISQNQMQAMQLSFLLLLPSILLSGFVFPFRGMPEWAQYIGSALPSTYLIRIIRGIMLKGSDIREILPHIWPLCVFVFIIVIIAIKMYKKKLD